MQHLPLHCYQYFVVITTLVYFVNYFFFTSLLNGYINLAKIQLNGTFRGYSHNVKNARIIEDLLANDTNKKSKKALINQFNYQGYCPIHLAVQNNNLDAAEVLLSDPRIDVNIGTDTNGKTALMLAVRENNYDMVKLLLSHKDIDLNTEDFSESTVLEYALESKCSDDIIVTLWCNIEERIKNGTIENYSIELGQDLEIEKKLDRIEAKYGIGIKSMVEFIYISELEGYWDEESDISEESEISEHEISEYQETEPELEMSDIEVEVDPAAKRQRRG